MHNIALFKIYSEKTELGSTFKSAAEPNYLGRLKLMLGLAHVKLEANVPLSSAERFVLRRLDYFCFQRV